jgi:glycosyltransferase involved in cell wall biosynthesis
MKILINAINLKIGGGLTLTLNFLEQLKNDEKYGDIQALVIAPPNLGYEFYNSKRIKIQTVSPFFTKPLIRFLFDFVFFGRVIQKYAPDIVFSMGNFPIPTSCKQAVIVMFPYLIYPEEGQIWRLLTFTTYLNYLGKNIIFKKRLKYAQLLFPQTLTSEQRLMHYYPKIVRTTIVPMAFSIIGTEKVTNSTYVPFKKITNIKYLLCLTKYYPHKNLEILLSVALLIKKRNLPYRILLTIEKNQGMGAKKLLNNIKINDLEDILINIRPVPIDEVPNLYGQVDALLLPTLLESFSATYADAMQFKKPIFTSDRDFSRDVCEDSALYFDPLDENDILNTIQSGFNNPSFLAEKIEQGYSRSLSYPNWPQVADTYINELKNLVNHCEPS